MIDELLAEGSVKLEGLDAIAFGRGPGSFTGVRLAASVTQGLAFGAGLGVIPISDLNAVAQRVLEPDPKVVRVLVCNDARMHEVYWACFERSPEGLAVAVGPESVGKPETVIVPTSWSPPVTGAGRGFAAYPQLSGLLRDASIYDRLLPRAVEIVTLAVPELRAGRILGPEQALPVYLRDNVAHVRQTSGPSP
jgi:tRNA threonylcarbamoyladenosine biosynthesis protein TsaB